MLKWLASFLTAPIINGFIEAYKARLSADNSHDRAAADLAAKAIAAEIDARKSADALLTAEQGRWYTAIRARPDGNQGRRDARHPAAGQGRALGRHRGLGPGGLRHRHLALADLQGVRRSMKKRVTYDVISYGEWTRPRMRDFREQCCDCGFIHRLPFRLVAGKGGSRPSSGSRVEFRTRRDDRATAAARRTFRFTPDE